MKNKLSLSLVILMTAISAIFYSCRKHVEFLSGEDSSIVNYELSKSNNAIKKDFDNQNIPLDSLRLDEFSNQKSFIIRWNIEWDSKFEKINRDSIGYIYIPIKAYYRIKSTDKERPLVNINIKKYILITIDEKRRSYDLIHTVPDNGSTSKTSEQRVILIAKNLSTSKRYTYYYENGKGTSRPSRGSGGNRAKTMAVNSGDGCTSTLFCTYNSYCNDGLHVYGIYSYDGYCTYPPSGGGCSNWILVESREVDKRCDKDPGFPPFPPLPGTGPGGTSGGTDPGAPGLPDLPYVFIKPDPCAQKIKVSNNQSSDQLRSKATQVLSNTDGKEWGSPHLLAELPLLDSKETGASLSYLFSPVTGGVANSEWDFDFTWNSNDGYTIGSTHLHPSNGAPSVDDAFRLLSQMNGNSDLLNSPQYVIDYYKNNVSSTIVTQDATYVITVRDWDELKKQFDIYNLDREKYSALQGRIANSYEGFYPNSSVGERTSFALLSLLNKAIVLYKAPAPNKNDSREINPPPIVFKPLEAGLKDEKPLVREQGCPD